MPEAGDARGEKRGQPSAQASAQVRQAPAMVGQRPVTKAGVHKPAKGVGGSVAIKAPFASSVPGPRLNP